MKKILKAIWLRLWGRHICEHEGCLNEGIQCRLDNYDKDYKWQGELFYWYCSDHCHIEGFCWWCGEFWGGCEAFDFSKSGLCPNCKDAVADDLGECDEEY